MSVNTLIPAAEAARKGGTVLMIDPMYDGFGYHGMHIPFLEITTKVLDEISKKVNVIVYSQGISQDDFYRFYPREMKLTNSLQAAIQGISHSQGAGAVIVMPSGPLTVPVPAGGIDCSGS